MKTCPPLDTNQYVEITTKNGENFAGYFHDHVESDNLSDADESNGLLSLELEFDDESEHEGENAILYLSIDDIYTLIAVTGRERE